MVSHIPDKVSRVLVVLTRAEAESAAQRLRKDWSLDAGPIRDLFSIIASRPDYVLVRRRSDGHGLDGIYAYDEALRKHFIYVNRSKPIVRQRFTAAHELGHAMQDLGERLDFDVTGVEGAAETAANQLAAEFLLPEASLREFVARDSGSATPETVKALVDSFGISLPVAVFRLHNCGLISDDARAAFLEAPIGGVYAMWPDTTTSDHLELPWKYRNAVNRRYERLLIKQAVALDALLLHEDEAALLPKRFPARPQREVNKDALL